MGDDCGGPGGDPAAASWRKHVGACDREASRDCQGHGGTCGGVGRATEVGAGAGTVAVRRLELRVRELSKEFPSMPASVVAERVRWTGSASWFRRQFALVRVDYAPRDPADRSTTRPGTMPWRGDWPSSRRCGMVAHVPAGGRAKFPQVRDGCPELCPEQGTCAGNCAGKGSEAQGVRRAAARAVGRSARRPCPTMSARVERADRRAAPEVR